MTKKIILLISDDPKSDQVVREALQRDYRLENAADRAAAAACLAEGRAELLLIDFDLKGEDGLQVYRELGSSLPAIMLSGSGSIPLVVAATKQGIAEFLRKPLDPAQLHLAVSRQLTREPVKLNWTSQAEWLSGGSPAIRQMFQEIQEALRVDRHLLLSGPAGTPLLPVAEFIHANSPRRRRRLVRVEAVPFRREMMEGHLWATLQKLLARPETGSLQDETERCGTIFLDRAETLDEHVRQSLQDFFSRKQGQSDKSVRAIIGLNVTGEPPAGAAGEFSLVRVPPLQERREDLPYLLDLCLKHFSQKYGKQVNYLDADLLDHLVTYDYPGNYLELQKLIEEGVLLARGDKLELEAFPFDQAGLQKVARVRSLRKNLSLAQARRAFERELYYILLKKTHGDSARVARFLGMPKAALASRLQDLLD